MDQQSVESLLRRLVQRVEESERRYSEALEDLHARLDQLAQTTDAARAAGTPEPEDAETFDRLHDQVSSLAQRLEREASTPLDDFERLGRALAGDLHYAAGMAGVSPNKPDLLSELAASSMPQSEPPIAGSAPFSFSRPETDYSLPPLTPSLPSEERDLDKSLVEMAHRLEHSIGTAMPPQALEALHARLDEIGHQIAKALDEAPKGRSLDHVEHQISDMAQQLGRAEAQLAKIGEIESALHQLIERVDANPDRLEEVATKAASEAARLVAAEAKLSTGTAERLDAMHRDLMAMNDRTRASDDRLAGTIEAVHESLKQLVQQAERSAPQPSAPKPRAPFAERMRDLAPLPGVAGQRPLAEGRTEQVQRPQTGETGAASPRNRLASAISDFDETDVAPPFGRAKRGQPDEKAFDLDTQDPRRALAKKEDDADYETPDDLVAAARRAAQAAALRAEERSSGSRLRRLSSATDTSAGAEFPSRRKRSFLIICAAVLLAISAILFYSRLRSKPEPEVTPPAAEQSAPLPSAPSEATPTPGAEENAPAPVEPKAETPPDRSGAYESLPGSEESPPDSAASDAGEKGNFTEVAKSSYRQTAASETLPQPQPASLKPTEAAALPPGVVFSIEDPALGAQAAAAPSGPSAPPSLAASLPLPPPDLGPLPLRQAAAEGDARAQYAIALRYAQGEGTPQNLTEAARWLERAASAGLAPAQYRLAVMYERGQGVAKDLGRARSWYQAAAEKGNVKAMHNLAVSASGREDSGADYELASKWYGEAASYGLADSQFNLGILAEHGLGIPKNLTEAYKWFALAANGGDEEAAKRRELVKPQLDPAGLADAERSVDAWAAKEAAPEANEVLEPQEWADASPATNASLVTRAQDLLNKLGYDVGVPDGLMGARTREAVKSFERRNGLEETGKVTIPLVTKLE
ncbi:MAG: peptidoglycan-binding protein, partial [Methyloceanibacter sp.]